MLAAVQRHFMLASDRVTDIGRELGRFKPRMTRSDVMVQWRRLVISIALIAAACPIAAAAETGVTGSASHIPVFARRYKVSCSLCHNPIPKLTPFGEQFAANGYRFSAAEEPRDTINTGDALLSLVKEFPVAMRLDAYAQVYSGGRAATDFQTPYGLKVLSSGTFSKKLSYYFYAFLFERGEIGGVEDAFVQVNDIGNKPVDVIVGQFQVSDPLFKRELRLEFEDYAVYRARLGEVPVDLTYDRGLMASADVVGFALTGQVLNGNGRGAAQSDRKFDRDPFKSFSLHLSRDVTKWLRLGAFGYTGKTESEGIRNQTKMFGFDATVGGGTVELNGQYLHRTDDRPTFNTLEPRAALDGGFAELIVRPQRSQWYGFGLYNLVTADRPLLDVRLGTAGGGRRYETVSAGIGRVERRNFRWTAEATYDFGQENVRWTLGIVTAF
jgi:hypothetical protein